MDLLKSAASLLSKSIPSFPYIIQDKVPLDDSIWTLYNGIRKVDSSRCSIFQFEIPRSRDRLPLARNAVRKLKTTRHPGVVRFLDSVETDQFIYLATERVEPLSWNIKRRVLDQEIVKWGLYEICKTIKFLHEEATSVHGNIRLSSIYSSESSEWKLFGFEVLTNVQDEDFVFTYSGILPQAKKYAAPEVVSRGWSGISKSDIFSTDSFALGILVYTLFNCPFDTQSELAFKKSIPNQMYLHYKNLLNPNPKTRLSTKDFMEFGLRHGSFFKGEVITFAEEVSSLGIMNNTERERVLNTLEKIYEKIPEAFARLKVLPELLKVFEFGGGGTRVFSLIISFSSHLTFEDFQSLVSPSIIRMFSSADVDIRLCLLENLDKIIDHFEKKTVNDKIFPNLLTGFSNQFPVVRELTIKSVLTIIPKLTDRNINNDLLRGLAKVQNDVQPGIRTNTTICLGMIARYLGENASSSTRRKVLTAAFTRSLKDPFPPARNAALLALAASMDMFSMEDCATRILPGLIPSLIDKDKAIRAQAEKTVDIYISRVKVMAADIPEVTAGLEGEKTIANVAVGWAGWAASGMKKMAAERLAAAASIPTERPSSTPPNASMQVHLQAKSLSVPLSEPVTALPTPLPDETIWDEDPSVWDDFGDNTDVGSKLKPKDDEDNAWENEWGLDEE